MCNITECVSYPYSVVQRLQDQINDLQARLREVPDQPNLIIDAPSPNIQPVPANLQKEAEEVGFLTTGGSNMYSGSKYGE